MSVAWFVDGAFVHRCWSRLQRNDHLDYLKLRQYLETQCAAGGTSDGIEDAYYFHAEGDPLSARQSAFHNALAFPPPNGPGLRVKLYPSEKRRLNWPPGMGGGTVVHPQTGVPYEFIHQKAADIGFAFHLVRSHARRGWTTLLLAAGDGDFAEVVQHLVEHDNVKVLLIGNLDIVSEQLRPYARAMVDLRAIGDQVARRRHSTATV
ncbi:MAG: NYN domain-containing protein [Gemmatimonadota bacterium]